MPSFSTPGPIDLAINLQVGLVEVIASDRDDTVVTVEPTNPTKAVDKRGAEETVVEFDGQRLTVVGPKPRLSFIGPTESVDLRIQLPTGSRLTAEVAVGDVRATGRLGATRVKASTGLVELEGTGDLWLRASHGSATAGSVDGSAEVTADHGQIRIASIAGDALLRASHGGVTIGETGGDVDAKLSYGELEIGTANASVTGVTAYGAIRVREARGGSLQLESGFGHVDVGIPAGLPVWLDLSSKEGRVRNDLDGEPAPADGEQSVAVRARTRFGDILIHRAR